MFATLDPTSRRLRLPREQEVIINDTVGFIRALAAGSAFRVSRNARRDWRQQSADSRCRCVESSLGATDSVSEKDPAELKLADIPSILALNKADLVEPDVLDAAVRQARQMDSGETVVISAIKPATLGVLLDKAGAVLARNLNAQPASDGERRSGLCLASHNGTPSTLQNST